MLPFHTLQESLDELLTEQEQAGALIVANRTALVRALLGTVDGYVDSIDQWIGDPESSQGLYPVQRYLTPQRRDANGNTPWESLP